MPISRALIQLRYALGAETTTVSTRHTFLFVLEAPSNPIPEILATAS